ncbi:MAG: hypothetical protein M1815_003041 [Lichina confinis]|nr:MAG: hypothetical protein M1815_003041 [Lichina confinis]
MSSSSSILKLLGICLWLAGVFVNAQHGPRRPRDWAARNRATIERIYELTLYPNQLPILQGGAAAVPERLFANGTRGRITPVGSFEDLEGTVEYFWGLAPVPQGPNGIVLNRAEVVSFQSQCPEVASSVVYLYTSRYNAETGTLGEEISILKQIAFWRFDDDGAVLYYDAWIATLQPWSTVTSGVDPSQPGVGEATIAQVCGLTQTRCTGNNTQYASLEDCVQTLSQKRLGDYNEVFGDTVTCRTIHLVLVQIRPEIHCPHVGPTGGGKCVDKPYLEKYFDDERLFGSPAGTTFVCDSKKRRGYH